MNWQGLADRANADPLVAKFARHADFRVLLRVGIAEHVIAVVEGKVGHVLTGPFVMPQCDFALSGSTDAWQRLCVAHPAPRDQDLFAFFRRGEIALTGDTRKFYAHQLCLKLLLGKLRAGE